MGFVEKRLPPAVPVHDKTGDPHLLCFFNLALDDSLPLANSRILRRVTDADVRRMPEPRLVHDEGFVACYQRERLAEWSCEDRGRSLVEAAK